LEFKPGVLGIRDHPETSAFMRAAEVLQGRLFAIALLIFLVVLVFGVFLGTLVF
jgi:uncharacterized membrane protein